MTYLEGLKATYQEHGYWMTVLMMIFRLVIVDHAGIAMTDAPDVKYPVLMVYAVDWNQFHEQHWPIQDNGVSTYHTAKGWMVGFLIEETEEHIVLAHTAFAPGDVRYAVVIPICTIIQRIEFALEWVKEEKG